MGRHDRAQTKAQKEHGEFSHDSASQKSHQDIEKHDSQEHDAHIAQSRTEDEEYFVPIKTWAVVVTLAFSYGTSFWPVPFFSTIEFQIAASFGSSSQDGAWFTSCYIIACTIAFMTCGANSDLFGRRWFIIGGNIFVFIGAVVGATSHSLRQSLVSQTFLGFGAGNCQLAAFAIPELLPNRWRHIGMVIADGVAFFPVIGAPVTARIAIRHGDAWRWGYWGVAISIALSCVVLGLYYYPPAHPRGVAWGKAVRTLDYGGILTFTLAASLALTGIVYVQSQPSNSPIVLGLLISGFGMLVIFALWETLAPLKNPLTPPRLFIHNKGRTLTAPFIVGFVVTMFYFGTNIIWGTMVSVFFSGPNNSLQDIYGLATVQGFGILVGGTALSFFGNTIGHWRWQMGLSVTWMTFWGGMLAYIIPERQSLGIAFAFLSATGFGWSQYLSITYVQFGAPQTELGIAGGLAGVGREAGGAVAVTVFQTILVSVQSRYAFRHVVPAAEAAGATPQIAVAVAEALPLGAEALAEVQGATEAVIGAAAAAFTESYVQGLKTVSLTLLGFGGLAMIACLFLEDIGPKMNRRIEIFLENDVEGYKNKYH